MTNTNDKKRQNDRKTTKKMTNPNDKKMTNDKPKRQKNDRNMTNKNDNIFIYRFPGSAVLGIS